MSEKVNKKRLKAAAVSLAVLIAAVAVIGVLELVVALIGDSVDFIKAGERWSGGGEAYAVISAYCESDTGIDENTLLMWQQSVDDALTEAAVTPSGGRLWAWAASFPTELSVSGPKGSTTAAVTVCAGDFFVFHRFDYVCGNGFLTDNENPMGVVLDENLAWKLFGATNIVGMKFNIYDCEYTVTGVYKPESRHGAYAYTYGETPRMYMSYAGFAKVSDGTFTVYETALPNPVRGFAKNIFDGAVSVDTDRNTVAEASDRFSVKNRFENMKELRYSWIRKQSLEYPHWENEARVYDYRCAVIMIFEIIFVAAGVIALLSSIILVVISGYSPVRTVKNIVSKLFAGRKKRKKK